jgi:hypothetical protein
VLSENSIRLKSSRSAMIEAEQPTQPLAAFHGAGHVVSRRRNAAPISRLPSPWWFRSEL